MKTVLVVMMLLVSSVCWADVSFECVKTDLDENGNIRIWSCHKIDGQEVSSQYPKINGKSVYCTRYSVQNFKGLDKKGVENYILNDIKNYSNVLVQREFDKKAPKTLNQIKKDYNATANQTFADTNLDQLVGKGTSVTEYEQEIDTDNDGINNKKIKIKYDGTKTETDI